MYAPQYNQGKPGNLVSTQDVAVYQNYLNNLDKDPKFRMELNNYQQHTNQVEEDLLRQGSTCTIKKLDSLQDKLTQINPMEFKQLLLRKFYDPSIMQEIMCTLNSIYYLQPNHPGAVRPNERIKHWLTHLKQIGAESAFGYAFKADFSTSQGAVVIKAPQNPSTDLLHETIVGIQLNVLRRHVPNFAYVFGGFKCTPPILLDPGHLLGPAERTPVSWCDSNSNFVVEYIIYENINPAVPMEDFVKNCTFPQFLGNYLQILFALLVGQKTPIEFQHGDLHPGNVLNRQLDKQVSIPYRNENDVVEYLLTDRIATMIDYGFSHVKLESGEHLGVTNVIAGGLFPDRILPLYDAYKLLMFSLFFMKQNKNFDCYKKCERLFRFFSNENMDYAVDRQRDFYYQLPDNEKTRKVGIPDLLAYIRSSVNEYSQVMSSTPKTQRILGCTGNDVCVTDEKSQTLLGYNTPMKIDNVFDFYDLVSRLEQEGRTSDIEEIYRLFEFEPALDKAYQEYNNSVIKINEYFNKEIIKGCSISDIHCDNIPNIYQEYKEFLIETAEINETFQQAGIIYDAIEFIAQRYTDFNKEDLKENFRNLKLMYDEFRMIMDSIRDDAIHLGPEKIKKFKLTELEILSNL
jgi:hypothetical protein